MTLAATVHAYERAQEQLGYSGTRETLAEVIASYKGTQAGLDMAAGIKFKVKIPQRRMIAVIQNGVIITVFGMGKPR